MEKNCIISFPLSSAGFTQIYIDIIQDYATVSFCCEITQGDGGIASFFLPQLPDDLLLIENNPVSRSERKAEATADRAVYRPQFNYL